MYDVYGIVCCPWFCNCCKFSWSFYDNKELSLPGNEGLVVIACCHTRLFPLAHTCTQHTHTHAHMHTHRGRIMHVLLWLCKNWALVGNGLRKFAWLLMVFCSGCCYACKISVLAEMAGCNVSLSVDCFHLTCTGALFCCNSWSSHGFAFPANRWGTRNCLCYLHLLLLVCARVCVLYFNGCIITWWSQCLQIRSQLYVVSMGIF